MWMMERILRNGDLAQRIMVDTDSQTAIVDAFQHGNNATRQLAEKALKHLNKIPTVTGVFLRVQEHSSKVSSMEKKTGC